MTRPRPLRDAALAVQLLTVVPLRARWPEDGRTGVSGWFPAVGLLLGGLGWGALHLAGVAGWDGRASLVVASLLVAAWAALTRLLHWDGLADVADGLWGGHTPERRLEIMADSHTGAFGAAAVALVMLLQASSIGSVLAAHHQLPVLLVPSLARCAATFAAWLGTPARPGGLGRSVMGRPGIVTVVPALIVLAAVGAAAWAGYGLLGVWFVVGAVVVTLGVPHVLSGPVGGVTGDVMGASVVLSEGMLFAAAALLWGA